MIDALRLMIARSPQASGQAMDCIKAIKAESPVLQHRYNRAAETAFADPNAEFSSEERELIASYIDDESVKSKRGGARPNTGLVQSVDAPKETWQALRTLMLSRYGKADKATVSTWFVGLVAEMWQAHDDDVQAKAQELTDVEIV